MINDTKRITKRYDWKSGSSGQYKKITAYAVRFWKNGKCVKRKEFPVYKFNSPIEALESARNWRDIMEVTLKCPPISDQDHLKIKLKNLLISHEELVRKDTLHKSEVTEQRLKYVKREFSGLIHEILNQK